MKSPDVDNYVVDNVNNYSGIFVNPINNKLLITEFKIDVVLIS